MSVISHGVRAESRCCVLGCCTLSDLCQSWFTIRVILNCSRILQLAVTHCSTMAVIVALLQLHSISVASHGDAAIAVSRHVDCDSQSVSGWATSRCGTTYTALWHRG